MADAAVAVPDPLPTADDFFGAAPAAPTVANEAAPAEAAPTPPAPDVEQHVNALIQHESGGKANAVGDSGLALGLGQMHPEVRRAYNVQPNSTPEEQKAAVNKYFTDLLNKHNGNTDDALSEYHLGATRYAKDRNSPDNVKYLQDHYKHLPTETTEETASTASETLPTANDFFGAAETPDDTSAATTPTAPPTFSGELAKEGQRLSESTKSLGEDLSVMPAMLSGKKEDFMEGLKAGVHAAWTAMGMVHPGAVPEAALTAAGHPTIGKVVGVATDASLPFVFGKGGAIKGAEEAATAVKGAISSTTAKAVAGSKAGYLARDVAADAANLTLQPTDPAVIALKNAAEDMVKKHGSKVTEWVDRIKELGTNGPVTHEELRNIEAGLTETAKRDPWIGSLRNSVKETRDAAEALAPDVAAQSAQLAEDYPAVAKLRRLKKLVVNPTNAPSTEKTTAEALRALNDPERLKQALATMNEKTANAFTLFHKQAKIAEKLSGGTLKGVYTPLLAVEGGRIMYNAAQGKYDLGEMGAVGAAMLLHDPRIAMMAARALTTPTTAPAAAVLTRSLSTALGMNDKSNAKD